MLSRNFQFHLYSWQTLCSEMYNDLLVIRSYGELSAKFLIGIVTKYLQSRRTRKRLNVNVTVNSGSIPKVRQRPLMLDLESGHVLKRSSTMEEKVCEGCTVKHSSVELRPDDMNMRDMCWGKPMSND